MLIIYGNNDTTVGGVQKLMINLTLGLINEDISFSLLITKQSYVYQTLIKLNISFNFIEISNQDEINNSVTKDDIIVIMDPIMDMSFLKEINPKIFYWCVHPYSIAWLNKVGPLNFKILSAKMANNLQKKSGIVYMDRTSFEITKNLLKLKYNTDEFIPIPIKTFKNNVFIRRSTSNTQPLRITYIGRGNEIWKIWPVVRICKDIEKYLLKNHDKKIELHIITDEAIGFQKLINIKPNKSFQIIYKINLFEQALSDYLLKNSDLHFSMGTSSLEGAPMGIPSILADASYYEIKSDHLYRWLFQAKDYSLGRMLTKNETVSDGYELSQIISIFSSEEETKKYSNLCFNYTKKHSIEASTRILIEKSNKSQARINDVSEYVLRNKFPFCTLIKTWHIIKRSINILVL